MTIAFDKGRYFFLLIHLLSPSLKFVAVGSKESTGASDKIDSTLVES